MRHAKPVRLETAPTGPGENIELPIVDFALKMLGQVAGKGWA